ncbi:MAG: helix-turn-helix transcriptional regulator [Planctomycetes bacterium]|nr:helix-turn-helix transcriptional regulator [Planctomycetota bacterium]
MDTPTQRLGTAARERRRLLGLTQEDVCLLAGVGPAFLIALEHGKPTMRLDKVPAVLAVLCLELAVREGHAGTAAPGAAVKHATELEVLRGDARAGLSRRIAGGASFQDDADYVAVGRRRA